MCIGASKILRGLEQGISGGGGVPPMLVGGKRKLMNYDTYIVGLRASTSRLLLSEHLMTMDMNDLNRLGSLPYKVSERRLYYGQTVRKSHQDGEIKCHHSSWVPICRMPHGSNLQKASRGVPMQSRKLRFQNHSPLATDGLTDFEPLFPSSITGLRRTHSTPLFEPKLHCLLEEAVAKCLGADR